MVYNTTCLLNRSLTAHFSHFRPGLPAWSVYRKLVGLPTFSRIRFFPQVVAGDLSKDEPLKGDTDQESNANDDNVSANETDTNHKDNPDAECGTVHTETVTNPVKYETDRYHSRLSSGQCVYSCHF